MAHRNRRSTPPWRWPQRESLLFVPKPCSCTSKSAMLLTISARQTDCQRCLCPSTPKQDALLVAGKRGRAASSPRRTRHAPFVEGRGELAGEGGEGGGKGKTSFQSCHRIQDPHRLLQARPAARTSTNLYWQPLFPGYPSRPDPHGAGTGSTRCGSLTLMVYVLFSLQMLFDWRCSR